METDVYQERYIDHQKRKTETITEVLPTTTERKEPLYNLRDLTAFREIIRNRRSQRIFNNKPITDNDFMWLLTAVMNAPSSCNRQAIYLMDVDPVVAEQYLVGGKKWIAKAQCVLFLFADKLAYKSPNEKEFMPFLDAGFVGQNMLLTAESLEMGSCFVNPNVRAEQKEEFKQVFGDDYFCGAVALGYYDKKAIEPPHRQIDSILKRVLTK